MREKEKDKRERERGREEWDIHVGREYYKDI